ncbi:RNA polymerase sigma-70 factor [Arachidicoccus sp.]|jgi:RNA polymerase sigma-70 factor (ECF subfamily)|uniref:RNA polymerase sigma-70 factor n=1 Tax=Arachidicoccus sp. TaxID=1872624 RepID=UPI003D2540E1
MLKIVNYKSLSDDDLAVILSMETKAFDEVYSRYYPLLLKIANGMLSDASAIEDLIQDVFISLYKRRMHIIFKVSIKAYLCKAIRLKIFNEYRSKAVHLKYCKNDFSLGYCKNDFLSLETKELSIQIKKVYQKLPNKCREVFYLSRHWGYSQKDISQKLQISVSTVEKHIGKALRIFREELHEYSAN